MDDKEKKAEFIAWYLDYFRAGEERAHHAWDNDHAAAVAWKAALCPQQPAPATQKLKEQVCISDINQSAACAVGSVGTTSDAQTTHSTHDAPVTQQVGEVRRAELVPGVMHCAKCKFQLNRVTLCVSDGNAYAGNNKTEPCPNGCGPLWPVTWEQETKNCWKALEEMHERLMAAAAPQPSPTAQAADSVPQTPKFRYYISDPFWGGITGTNSEETARGFAAVEDYFVVDTVTGMQLACPPTSPDSKVPEVKQQP